MVNRLRVSNRTSLLFIATVGIGIFLLPSTLSLFAGQHTFYAGDDVSCRKCHQDIFDELYYGSVTSGPHLSFGQNCMACHRTGYTVMNVNNSFGISPRLPYLSPNSFFLGINSSETGFHAATTLECVFCHDRVPPQLTNVSEAHTIFYQNATSTRTLYYNNGTPKPNSGNQSVILLKGANTACIGCHTHIWINATWIRNSGYGIDVSETGGNYNITFSLNRTNVVTAVTANRGT